MTLLEFVEERNSDPYKISSKYYHGYIDLFYDRLFTPIKDSILNILEIGVQGGNSITLWRDYFKQSKVYGLDIIKCDALDDQERIVHIVGDAYTESFIENLPEKQFDIIIDDGPHTFESMVFFLNNYIKLLNPNGLFILEDIVDINWTPHLVSLVDQTKYDVEIIETKDHQKLPELKEMWANGLQCLVIRPKSN